VRPTDPSTLSSTSTRFAIEPAGVGDADAILRLVASSGLPLDGLHEHRGRMLVARDGAGQVAGCAALEPYGPFALLRSVAVAEAGRSRGLGSLLVGHALERARRDGVEEVFLLTETAAPFFARLGFLPVDRARVPPDVQASVEFAAVCPSTAHAMSFRPNEHRVEGDAPRTRAATACDAEAIVAIYNQGIEDRLATFETRRRQASDVTAWFDGRHPVTVVETGRGHGRAVVAFAATFPYRPRECYAGVAEFSVYTERSARRQGHGRLAMRSLLDAAERAGYWKLVSRVFVENAASRHLLASQGFREVGIYYRHGRLDGVWRDVVIVERLLDRRT
jgi:phosphinothricin acetyltransferase